MNTSLGQVAYEAVQQYLASAGESGDVPPEVDASWEQLLPPYREAWEAGAQAVLAANGGAVDPSAEVPGTRAVGEGSIWAKVDPERYPEPEEPERLA